MSTKRTERHCKSRTKTGKPCRAAATAGGLCFFHAHPNKASELGRKGGSRSKRHAAADGAGSPPSLETVKEVREAMAGLFADAYSGRRKPREAAILAQMLNLQLRAIDTSDLERRILELEKRLAETQPAPASDSEGDGRSLDPDRSYEA